MVVVVMVVMMVVVGMLRPCATILPALLLVLYVHAMRPSLTSVVGTFPNAHLPLTGAHPAHTTSPSCCCPANLGRRHVRRVLIHCTTPGHGRSSRSIAALVTTLLLLLVLARCCTGASTPATPLCGS
jgi:hypothetical protein